MLLACLGLIFGLVLLTLSADRFIEGAAETARHFGMSPLFIGMVIVGFGTSAPEMVVSLLSAMQGNPGIALGNAYGSNITNMALILGITALIAPIFVQRRIIVREFPVLLAVTALTVVLLLDGELSRFDGVVLMAALAAVFLPTVFKALRGGDNLVEDIATEFESEESRMSLRRALVVLVLGLIVLVLSSRLLVWGAVTIAQGFGVSDLVIGLTVVAVGTSLPELASSVIAARKGQHDIAMGNVIGSNLFNTLAVVGLAALVSPMQPGAEVLNRDVAIMSALTVVVFGLCWLLKGRLNRVVGLGLLLVYIAYTVYLVMGSFGSVAGA
ncbi:MAG: calcium/sodium antiporter [Neisseria zoodegmatis]|uniref:calcium/sodium antiporter n=1 Tax=Neisseria zoodegmatis TaxID=326523 RepID=UPI0026EFACD9|nr:calcium/sodium antiporter [Neisseria zoodegmatis]MDO5069488.1 calcium/sodium antiporter [Neisseria zoodegmatis]